MQSQGFIPLTKEEQFNQVDYFTENYNMSSMKLIWNYYIHSKQPKVSQ